MSAFAGSLQFAFPIGVSTTVGLTAFTRIYVLPDEYQITSMTLDTHHASRSSVLTSINLDIV
jgi:hypothetical protein